mmetsp:Transcript_20617/g.49926  ORF Transcript_20617/g.49926 Transcript_20617/m.49926 type:complete len:220 (-) Transcript_20617:681-1340(-)
MLSSAEAETETIEELRLFAIPGEGFAEGPFESLPMSFTRAAYRRVLTVSPHEAPEGEMLAIITVFPLPTNDSFRTCVSLLERNGVYPELGSVMERMHSLSASSDLLISAPSMRVFFSFSAVSEPFSDPARSMKDSWPWSLPLALRIDICRIACDRDDCSFIPVVEVLRLADPPSMASIMSSTQLTASSVRPARITFFLASSRGMIFFLFAERRSSTSSP